MKIDKKKFRELETIAMCFFLLPVVAVSVVKFLYQARKDLRLPSKNDMWE